MVFFEQVFVHARLVVVTLKVCRGDELDEIFIARVVCRKKRQVEAFIVNAWFFVKARAVGNIGLNADDGLDAFLLACFVKFNRAIKVAVVGERERRHAVFFCLFHQRGNFGESVKQAVVAVGVEMDERGLHSGYSIRERCYHVSMVPKTNRREFARSDIKYFIGVDEAGRGPLAGPVAVGVVCVPLLCTGRAAHPLLRARGKRGNAKDSKQLTEAAREACFKDIQKAKKEGTLYFSVALVGAGYIDRRGIVWAVHECIQRSLLKLNINPEECVVLLDGSLKAPPEFRSQKTIIRGDATEPIIALASIVAKVTRDRKMCRVARKYPAYGFEKHKGYGTRAHYEAIQRNGICLLHRRSFLKKMNT